VPVPTPANLAGLLVLVVDDEADTRQYVEAALRQHGADVITAASTREALECVAIRRPHVILADIAMPGEDGLSFIRKVRQLPGPMGGTPASALTAFASEADRARAIDAGFDLHLSKPLDLPLLIDGVLQLARRTQRPAASVAADPAPVPDRAGATIAQSE
jgi:CheY-like chemotaxis protein